MAHLCNIRSHSIFLVLFSNMILAGTDTLRQLPHQLLKCLDFSFGLEGTTPSTLSILDSIQRKDIRLIDDPVLTGRIPSLAHRRAIGDLSHFYRYFHRLCSEELASNIPPLAVRSRVMRGALLCILIPSSCRSLEHPITCVPSHPGCPNYGTS